MFNNLKIIELASVLAGPSVGQFFAELGSEVIKIENPKTNGDVTRSWKTRTEDTSINISAYFTAINWGKKSVLLDLTNTQELNQFYELVKQSDIIISSYKPGDAELLKVDYEFLKTINPKIIYGHITGYNHPSSRLGYDAIIQAETGFMDLNGEKNGESVKMPVALIDILAGHQLKEAILVALINRIKTDIGAYVHVSLHHSALASLANQATNYLMTGVVPKKSGSEHPNIVPYGTKYTTKDEFEIILAIGNDKQFESLCKVLKLTDIHNNELYNTNINRVQNRELIIEIIKNEIIKYEKDFLLSELENANIPSGAINNIKTVFENDDLKEIIFVKDNFKSVRTFIATGVSKMKKLSPPPLLGNDTKSILENI